MNNEEVRRHLASLHECREAFTVGFTGKKSGRVNGTYRSGEIKINDRNFLSEGGGLNESALMYTAMHELAHHIQHTEYGQRGRRSHTKLFHAILDGLADKAEEAGVYRPAAGPKTAGLLEEVEMISQEIAKLQRELGRVLRRLNEACAEEGARFEDMVKRKARISLETAEKCCKIAALDLPDGITADVQEAVAGEREAIKRRAMALAAQAGRSVAQVKRAGLPPAPSGGKESEEEKLLREKGRLEKAIAELRRRLGRVMEKLHGCGP